MTVCYVRGTITTMDFIGLNEAINRWCTVIKNYNERVAKDELRRKEQEEFRKNENKGCMHKSR